VLNGRRKDSFDLSNNINFVFLSSTACTPKYVSFCGPLHPVSPHIIHGSITILCVSKFFIFVWLITMDTVLNEQGSNCRIFSDMLHRRLGVVKNEQESSHLTRRMWRIWKLAKPSIAGI
jgi:hypothetical protein